jgi:HisA/HisF family protein
MTLQPEVSQSHASTAFAVIPVLDLKDGLVVHARAGKQAHAGKRAEYRPIATPFGPPHDAAAIARALLGITFSPALYIADLDAILGRGNNFDICRGLSYALRNTDLWIDAGFSDVSDCAFWLPLDATLVIGSETVASLEDWQALRESFGQNLVLSLDFDEQGLRGPKELMTDPSLWPDRLILMSLGRVGTEIGPDLARLQGTLRVAGNRAVYVGGGVAELDDINQVAQAGAAGVLAATALHSGAVTQKEIAALVGERRS